MSLLLNRRLEAPKSRIQGPDECERQVEALPVWAISKIDADFGCLSEVEVFLILVGCKNNSPRCG